MKKTTFSKAKLILSIVAAFVVPSISAQTLIGCDTTMFNGKQMIRKTVQEFSDGTKVVTDSLFEDGRFLTFTRTNWLAYEGKPMPSFTVKTENGASISLESLRGKTVVVSFWISTCGPCLKELRRVGPEIVDVLPKDDFVFLAIGSGENAESAKIFRERAAATFPLCYDETGEVIKSFADQGFPKTFLIDRNGIIRLAEKGYTSEKFDTLKKRINEVMR